MSRWGDEKTIQFIILYRQCECLWKPSHSLYKNKKARAKAYTRIEDEFELTLKEVTNKIKSLRSTYHQELNKVRKSKLSGAEYEHVYKPCLTWFKEMTFLNDTFEYRKAVHTEIQPPSKVSTATADPLKSTSQVAIKITTQNKRRRVEENETELQSPEKISTPMNNPRFNEDEFYYFGQNVAAQLRSLPLNNALDLQSKIQLLLSKERSLLSVTYSQPSTPF